MSGAVALNGDVGDRYILSDLGFARYEVVSSSDTGGFYVASLANTNKLKLIRYGAFIDPQWFGLVYDGDEAVPTDNKDTIDAMFSYLKSVSYPDTDGGLVMFEGAKGRSFATSGGHVLPQCNFNGNNVRVRPLTSNSTIFALDLRFGIQNGRFVQGWEFGNFVMWSDRGFNETTGLDCNHFLDIQGGWLIRARIFNINCQPGFSCRSIVNWDLTHQELPGITEVGVPDGIEFHRISAQYALNTSFAISIKGDGLGTGSRISSTRFTDIYNSISYPKDFETRSNSTNDFGVIRLDTCRLSRSEFSEIYGPQPIKMFGDAAISVSNFNRIYSEFNNPIVSDFESMFRSGEYVRCNFYDLNMYSINTNLTAPPRFMFAKFTNCTFHRVSAQVQSIITNAPNANLFDLGATSSGNTILEAPRIIVGIGISNPPTAGLPYTMTKMSAPSDTRMTFCEPKQLKVKSLQTFSADGTVVVGSVPESMTELNAYCKFRCTVKLPLTSYTADLSTSVSGDGVTSSKSSAVRNYSGADGVVNFSVEFVGRSDLQSAPAYNRFSENAVVIFNIHGGLSYDKLDGDTGATDHARVYNKSDAFDDLNIQYQSGDYDISLTVANLTGSGGGNGLILNSVLEYGYTDEYINYY